MLLSVLFSFVAASYAELTFFEKSKEAMRNLSFCGIPYNKGQFNRSLDRCNGFTQLFKRSIFSTNLFATSRTFFGWEDFYLRIVFIVTHLNNQQSGLCVSLRENPLSYLNHLIHAFSHRSKLEISGVNCTSGFAMFNEFFDCPFLMDEILWEFSSNASLKYSDFQESLSTIASSNLLMLRTMNKNVEIDAVSVKRAIYNRIEEFLAFLAAFNQILRPNDSFVFWKLIQLLSMTNFATNKCLHLLIFAQGNPISKWITANYSHAVQLTDKTQFIDLYLDFLLDPEIYCYIWATLRPFNTIERARTLTQWQESDYVLCEVTVKSLIFTTLYTRNLYNNMELCYPGLAAISFIPLNSNKLGLQFMQIFNINLDHHEQLFLGLFSVIEVTMTYQWYKIITGNDHSNDILEWVKEYSEVLLTLICQDEIEVVRNVLIVSIEATNYSELVNFESNEVEIASERESKIPDLMFTVTSMKHILTHLNSLEREIK